MCLCVKFACPVLVNLGSRACNEIADLVCFVIMRRSSSKSQGFFFILSYL